MLIDSCSWDRPGTDPYSGTSAAAIMAMAEIPQPVRLVLAERAERHDFYDAVLIDRDSIRGQRADYTDLRSMAFGSRGKVCTTVTRNWPASQVEGGWVYCEGAWCVLMPAPCRNWSIVTRIDRPAPLAPLAPAYLDGADLIPAGPIGTGPGYAYAIPLAPAIGEGQGYGASWGAQGGFGYAIDFRQTALCDCVPRVVCVPAVPEPMTAVLLIAGLAAVAVWRKRA